MRKVKFISFLAFLCVWNCSEVPEHEKCGSNEYAIEKEFCYNNAVYEKCGGKEYNPETNFCMSNDYYEKCGGKEYNPSTHFCGTDGAVYNFCSGDRYNSETEGCANGLVKTKCDSGTELFDKNSEFCVDNKVYLLCGGRNYNIASEKCENNTVKTKCGSSPEFYDKITQFCLDDKIYQLCNGTDYNPAEYKCENNVLKTHCGTEWYDPLEQFCLDDKIYQLCKGMDYNPAEYKCENDILFLEFTDWRDNQEYKGVVIGTQTWMARNLNYRNTVSNPNDTVGFCYNNNASYCTQYGRMYNWNDAMVVCPEGWHLPNSAEWDVLVDYADAKRAGIKLKAKSGWRCYNEYHALYVDGNGADNYGFAALSGGSGSTIISGGRSIGYFNNNTCYSGYWWSATEYDNDSAYCLNMSNYSDVVSTSNYGKRDLTYVRCVKDL